MILSIVGPKEKDNLLRLKLARKFNCPIYSFSVIVKDLIKALELDGNICPITFRKNLNSFNKNFLMDCLTKQLVDDIFCRNENISNIIQAVVLDVETEWEFRSLKTFMITPKSKKANKFVLLENEEAYKLDINKDYNEYLNWDIDYVVDAFSEYYEEEVFDITKCYQKKSPAIGGEVGFY